MSKQFVMVRHAEALKNLHGTHGGHGSRLTPSGRESARAYAENTLKELAIFDAIQFTDTPQCLETAEVFGEVLGLSPTRAPHLQRHHLGVLDGLSDAEAAERYPDVARRMGLWRRGLIDIAALDLPGADSFETFFEAGQSYCDYLTSSSITTILVGTRSPLVLMWNVLNRHLPTSGGGYYERPFANLEWIEFELVDAKWREVRTNR